MCTSKKEIRLSNGRKMYVKCGKCPACLQEKAFARAQRIKNHAKPEYMNLFCTFTYCNQCVPYFDFKELVSSPVLYSKRDTYKTKYFDEDSAFASGVFDDVECLSLSEDTDSGFSEGQPYKMVNVYRNSRVYHARCSSDYSTKLVRKHERVLLGSFPVKYPECDTTPYKYLRNSHSTRVGVCFYPDFQNFLKRLRQNLNRKKEYANLKLRGYYVCTEFGPTTQRPHLHAVISTENTEKEIEVWKCAIAEAWAFDNHNRAAKFCEIAKDASSYVSSYVNCASYVPAVFQQSRTFRPSHHYSKGYGFGNSSFSLSKILQAFEAGSLRYLRGHLKDGSYAVDSCLFPKYVVHRFFPKFKGYCRLTCNEIESILLRPEKYAEFAGICDCSKEQTRKIITYLKNKQAQAVDNGMNLFDFARVGSRIWQLYASNLLEDFYSSVSQTSNYFELYDNIKDLYSSSCRNYSLEDLALSMPSNYHFEDNPNLFQCNIAATLKMNFFYYAYEKQKKLNNSLYSNIYKYSF